MDRKVSVQLARKPNEQTNGDDTSQNQRRKRFTYRGRGRGGRGRGRGGRAVRTFHSFALGYKLISS